MSQFDALNVGIPLDRSYKFTRRPLALAPDQRLSWRLPLLLLTLKYVRSGKASFKRVAIASFALRNVQSRKRLERILSAGFALDALPLRYEPGLPYLVNFAFAKRLILLGANGLFQLSDLGVQTALEIESAGAYESELAFLKSFGAKLNEASLGRITRSGLHPESE